MRQSVVLEDLRARIAQIEGVGASHEAIPFGLSELDGRLPGGGIATGALHEITGSPDLADDASATTPAYPYWHQKGFQERNPFPV